MSCKCGWNRPTTSLFLCLALFSLATGCSFVEEVGIGGGGQIEGDTPNLKLRSGKWATTDGKYRVVASVSSNDPISKVQAKLSEPYFDGKTLATTELHRDEHGRWVGEMTFDADSAKLSLHPIDIHGDTSTMIRSPIQPDDPTDRTHVILSQDDLDEICEHNCRRLLGDLVIQAVPGFENFDGLQEVEEITGELKVMHNPEFETFEHLTSLEKLGGLRLQNNRTLTSLKGLSSTNLYGSVYILGNDRLETVASLNLYESMGTLSFVGNDNLQNLAGFETLTSATSLRLIDNDSLSAISALNSLTSLEHLIVEKNKKLASLNGFERLQEVTDKLEFKKNPALDACAKRNFVESLETRPDDYQMPSTTCR